MAVVDQNFIRIFGCSKRVLQEIWKWDKSLP